MTFNTVAKRVFDIFQGAKTCLGLTSSTIPNFRLFSFSQTLVLYWVASIRLSGIPAYAYILLSAFQRAGAFGQGHYMVRKETHGLGQAKGQE